MIRTPTVVLFSQLNDIHSDRLCSELSELGAVPFRLDAENILNAETVFEDNHYSISYDGRTASQKNVTSAFVRRRPLPKDFGTENVGSSASVAQYIALQKEALFQDAFFAFQRSSRFYNEFGPASAMMGKGIQYKLAYHLGFKIPATQMGGTNQQVASFIRECWRRGKDACSKPLSPAYLDEGDGLLTRYTEKIDRAINLDEEDFQACPLIIQEYIEKAYELRVTVCDDSAIAVRIESQLAAEGTEIDWRKYNIPQTPHYEHSLDDQIKGKLVEFNRSAGLRFSCFDLIVTPKNEFYFVETNQSGQWLWLEEITGAKITKMIAKQLIGAP